MEQEQEPERKTPLKRKTLTLTEKLEILSKFDSQNVVNKKVFAQSVNIPESSLRTLLRNREEIERNAAISSAKRKKLKSGKHEEIEKILIEWIVQARSFNIPINGPVIKEKAFEIARLLETEFSASSGWLDRFKNRHGIVYTPISRVAPMMIFNEEDPAYWASNVLPQVITEFANSDIYSLDEFALYFRLMPDNADLFQGEWCHGGKFSEERITVLVCCNADGTDKLKPLVIGKPRNPNCFQNFSCLPCDYSNQNRAFVTADNFIRWLRDFDIRMGRASRKIALCLDSCPAHPKAIPGLKNIRLVFIPQDSTMLHHPMLQGIIKFLKRQYRKRLLQRYISDKGRKDYSPVNLLESMHYIRAAWDCIEPKVIADCFRRAGLKTEDGIKMEEVDNINDSLDDEKDWISLCEHLGGNWISMESYIGIDDGVITSEIRSIENIIDDVIDEDVADIPVIVEQPPVPSMSAVMEALNIVRQYASSLDPHYSEEVRLHISAAEQAIMRHGPSVRQTRQSTM